MSRRENILTLLKKRSPFFTLLITWIIGILMADCIGISFHYGAFQDNVLFVIAASGIAVAGMVRLPFLNMALPLAAMVMTSALWYGMDKPNEVNEIPPEYGLLGARVDNIEKGRTYSRVFLEGLCLDRGSGQIDFKERILLFCPESLTVQLSDGDLILVRAKISRIESPPWPGAFDWKQFYLQKGIVWNTWIRDASDLIVVVQGRQTLLAKLQKVISKEIETSALSTDARSMVKALILGDKSGLSQDLRQNFTGSGVSHVLAVSGLHVGLLYLLVSSILSRFRRFASFPFIEAFLLSFTIWTYAGLTDFSSSVVRSSLMFSLIGFATALRRRSAIYNSLFASAFFILVFDPKRLFDLGFLLSYSAVLAIIGLHPILRTFLHSGRNWWDKVLNLSCVSVSAQLGTLPLTLHTFGVFPLYFIFANLLVIPLITVLLICSMVFCLIALADINAILFLLTPLINAIVACLHHSTAFIGADESATMDLPINQLQSIVFAFAILLMTYSVYFLKRFHFALSLILFSILPLIIPQGEEDSKRHYILRQSGDMILGYINGRSHSTALIKGRYSGKIIQAVHDVSDFYKTDSPAFSRSQYPVIARLGTNDGFSIDLADEDIESGKVCLDTNAYVVRTDSSARPVKYGRELEELSYKLEYTDYIEWIN